MEAERGLISTAIERRVWADIKPADGDSTLFSVLPPDHVYITTERKTIDVSELDPRFAGWQARVTSGDGWHAVTAIPPPWPLGLVYSLGSEIGRHQAGQIRKLILICCATAWSVVFALLPVAGPWRRKLARIAIAASLLAAFTWAANDVRPRILSLPALDWIACAAMAGLLVSIVAVAIPLRRGARRPGHCGACDYDLTGNLSGICPECGCITPAELRRRRDKQLAPLAEAIQETIVEPIPEEEPDCDEESNRDEELNYNEEPEPQVARSSDKTLVCDLPGVVTSVTMRD